MNEEEDISIPKVQVNLAKASTSELKKMPITSSNAITITKEILKREPKVMIKIASTERDKSPVFVGTNGHAYNIPRDKWFPVPKSVIGVLEHCRQTIYTVKADPSKSDNAEINSDEISRFSISTKPVENDASVTSQKK
jgi:hypothetical protein